ncbi:stage III sporulation protein AF [Vulcanibacillus modesticaldus]|uniref:Stage III sporulation protein AF n=1 Tax=Vulcanibacillus modesticaldus TaxID=337097 RepID=A0A1D2YRS5_9BACI|nr:stage III sporulation protein AF [Vulcanibacillus modesticaldus]OEF95512.1 stage III sporulation protein AF [Vulcanibacillus modesticaldus]
MIEWLNNWIKDIIILVLLASFVDILLPNSKIQKYARMVMGLLIILAILSPIMSIFSDNVLLSKLTQQLNSQSYSGKKVNTIEQLRSIQDKGKGLYEKKMLDQVEQTMEKDLKTILENKLGIKVQDLKLDAIVKDDKWKIQRIDLYLSDSKKELVDNEDETIKEVESVKIVNIKLGQGESSYNQKTTSEAEQKIIEEVNNLIQQEWGIPKEYIYIHLESDT